MTTVRDQWCRRNPAERGIYSDNPYCACTYEEGDSDCTEHPTCSECGADYNGGLIAAVRALRLENAGLLGTNHGQAVSEAFFRERCDQIEDRIATIASEAFGPFPVQPVEENLSAIERGISEQHIERERFRSALEKISAIRDSIVGCQGFDFSEHAYPLVAVLDAAGFKGAGYEIARKNLGTLIEQAKAAEAERDDLRAQLTVVQDELASLKQRIAAFTTNHGGGS